MNEFEKLSEFVQIGEIDQVIQLVGELLNCTVDVKKILDCGLMTGMNMISEKFKNNEVFVPEVMLAARAMNAGIEILKPALTKNDISDKGKIVLGTVKGDLHDIGKNLVKIMMEGKGIEVIDLGTNVPPSEFVNKALEYGANIIGCSALLTTTMPVMKQIVEQAEKSGIRDTVKIMIGGAPLTQEYCDKISADYYTPDAATAADVALQILNKVKKNN